MWKSHFLVMLLEIVSGKKNSTITRLNNGDDLLTLIWTSWIEGKGLEVVDPVISASSPSFRPDQVLKCIQIGLLCVQELPEDRPTMSSVLRMLGSEIDDIPQPKSPAETASPSRDRESITVAQITLSTINNNTSN